MHGEPKWKDLHTSNFFKAHFSRDKTVHCFRPQRLETWPNFRPKGIKSQPGTKILSDRSEGKRRKKHRPARVGTTRQASLTDTKSCPVQTASQYNMNTYPICDYPLWKSAQKQKLRRNHHFYVWIEALTNSKPLECEDSFTNQQHSNFLLYCRRQNSVKQPHLNP